MAIRILGDRVLVALPPRENEIQHASGLTLMRDPELRTETRGIVVAVGEKSQDVKLADALAACDEVEAENHKAQWAKYGPNRVKDALRKLGPAPFDVQVNDCVIFSPSSGELIEDDYLRYVILRESEIIAVLEPSVNADEAA